MYSTAFLNLNISIHSNVQTTRNRKYYFNSTMVIFPSLPILIGPQNVYL